MSAPTLTNGLQNLRRQLDERFPNRDKRSDGWIGDTAHQGRTSGHNPDDTSGSRPAWNGDSDGKPEVRAYDQDADLGEPGVTAQMEVDHIRRLPGVEKVLRYIIYDRKIYHSRAGFAPAPYTGSDPHTEHIHFEGAWSDAGDNNDDFDFRLRDLGGDMLVRKGDSGEEVKLWQNLLADLGFSPGKIDGDYGAQTEAAVNAFRASHGVEPYPAVTGWTGYALMRDLAAKHAGRDGKDGRDGADGKDGAPGRLTGALTVTGGQLTVDTTPPVAP